MRIERLSIIDKHQSSTPVKIFPNLAGGLRFYFGVARILAVVFAAFWILILTLGPSLQKLLFVDEPKLMVSVGDASLKTEPNAVGLKSDTARPGSLAVVNLRGAFQADLLSNDPALASALRWTVFPSIAVFTALCWLLFSSLRGVCANIERGEVFTESNLRLVRSTGLMLIAYSVIAFATQLWASHVMSGYLTQHVSLTGITTGSQFPGGLGAVRLSFSTGAISVEASLVAGCLVLMMCEAFRQGLALKSENDLTV